MPRLAARSPAKQRLVRSIQRWLKKNEHGCYFDFKIADTNLRDSHHRNISICQQGVVTSVGGGAVIDSWTEFDLSEIKKLFNSAKTVAEGISQ